ncbi:hypothetical protein LTR50_007518 [Elasticomyces elasticus]|nr:hypothetical protein LTR50_007518 [Elasticomyces elasticus]
MATANTRNYVRAFRSLPPPLINFFKKYPPPALSFTTTTTTTSEPAVSLAENTSTPSSQTTPPEYRNPFLPFKSPSTLRWQPPAFSLRRQAQLYKLAEQHNVLPLLPPSAKHPVERQRRREEFGLRVKGTGVGQKVKGKLWERTLKGRLEARRKAMEGMGEMVKTWKERGHGRGWKKWPK